MNASNPNFKGDRKEELDFELLWPAFQEQPFAISLNQLLVLLEGLHHRSQLDEPTVNGILKSVEIDESVEEKLLSQKPYLDPPQRRLELWRASDTTALSLVSWLPGTLTRIHDHSHFGLTRTLKGSVASLGFKLIDEKTLEYLGRVHFERNRVYHVPVGENFIHAIANTHEEEALELHFYGPILEGRKSHQYDCVDKIDLSTLEDGQRIPITRSIDFDRSEKRSN